MEIKNHNAFIDYANLFFALGTALQDPSLIEQIGETSFSRRYPALKLTHSDNEKARKLERLLKEGCTLFSLSTEPDKDLVMEVVYNGLRLCGLNKQRANTSTKRLGVYAH